MAYTNEFTSKYEEMLTESFHISLARKCHVSEMELKRAEEGLLTINEAFNDITSMTNQHVAKYITHMNNLMSAAENAHNSGDIDKRNQLHKDMAAKSIEFHTTAQNAAARHGGAYTKAFQPHEKTLSTLHNNINAQRARHDVQGTVDFNPKAARAA